MLSPIGTPTHLKNGLEKTLQLKVLYTMYLDEHSCGVYHRYSMHETKHIVKQGCVHNFDDVRILSKGPYRLENEEKKPKTAVLSICRSSRHRARATRQFFFGCGGGYYRNRVRPAQQAAWRNRNASSPEDPQCKQPRGHAMQAAWRNRNVSSFKARAWHDVIHLPRVKTSMKAG